MTPIKNVFDYSIGKYVNKKENFSGEKITSISIII